MHGADIHACDECSLQWAAMEGHIEVVKFLVAQGADIHADDDDALKLAASKGHLEIVDFLVEKGTPIAVAKEHGTEAVKDLCKAYELRKMLDNKLHQDTSTKTKPNKLKI